LAGRDRLHRCAAHSGAYTAGGRRRKEQWESDGTHVVQRAPDVVELAETTLKTRRLIELDVPAAQSRPPNPVTVAEVYGRLEAGPSFWTGALFWCKIL